MTKKSQNVSKITRNAANVKNDEIPKNSKNSDEHTNMFRTNRQTDRQGSSALLYRQYYPFKNIQKLQRFKIPLFMNPQFSEIATEYSRNN